MTIENPTVEDMELIALNLHREGENSRSEALYKFIAKYKANERKVTALETAGRKLVNSLPTHELDLARDVWGNTNVNVVEKYRDELAALLNNPPLEKE